MRSAKFSLIFPNHHTIITTISPFSKWALTGGSFESWKSGGRPRQKGKKKKGVGQTFARIASSIGVLDPMVESCRPTLEKPSAYRRNIRGEKKEGRGWRDSVCRKRWELRASAFRRLGSTGCFMQWMFSQKLSFSLCCWFSF